VIYRCAAKDKRDLKAEIIKCAYCGYSLEIFSDEAKIKCPRCKRISYKKRSISCLDWCRFARECSGSLGEFENVQS